MECVVHYCDLANYTLKQLTETNIERIKLAKNKRLRLGRRHHQPQCDQIPDVIDPNVHKIHVECYKS